MTVSCLPPALLLNYSHSYYPNGFRRSLQDRTATNLPDLVAFETAQFGIIVNVADLSHVKAGMFETNDRSYLDCLDNRDHMQQVVDELLIIQVIVNSKAYRVVSCESPTRAKQGEEMPFNSGLKLWEAGKIVQHYELMGLILEDDSMTVLQGTFSLEIVVWPDCAVFTLNLTSPEDATWDSTSVTMQLMHWNVKKDLEGGPSNEQKSVSLTCNIDPEHRKSLRDNISFAVDFEDHQINVMYSDKFNCYMATLPNMTRRFPVGYTDIREYDDISVSLTNSSNEIVYAPLIQYISVPPNVTGMAPMICSTDGVPTGIPIQLSKNWHEPVRPSYAYLFTFLPVPPDSTVEYIIRVAYGFYGNIPSASHAQLSLVGYRQYTGRWEQLAIGCFGETFCMDPETSIAVTTITDVRGLMLRNGPDADKWGWTTCGNGGDWLMAFHTETARQFWINSLKVAYLSHGPCLTDVRYQGCYGDARQVDFTARVRTVRTDDYARTFVSMKYCFLDTVQFSTNGYFHMVRSHGFYTRDIAFGYRNELLYKCQDIPENLTQGEIFVPDTTLEGPGPWWVSYPQNEQWYPSKMGPGTKHCIIQSYEATVGNICYNQPTISFQNYQELTQEKIPIPRKSSLDCLVRPPKGISELHKGDSVSLEVMYMTTATVADNYYGPNNQLRSFLTIKPKSWEIVPREVNYNYSNVVVVDGGDMESKYPLKILVKSEVVNISMKGGLGGYPMEFYGLTHINYDLVQIVQNEVVTLKNGDKNDYWQTDYDIVSGTYTMTYNPILGSTYETDWRFMALDQCP